MICSDEGPSAHQLYNLLRWPIYIFDLVDINKLKRLKLADYSTGEDGITVDILVGTEQYWQLVSGKVTGGRMAPLQFRQGLDGFSKDQQMEQCKMTNSRTIL